MPIRAAFFSLKLASEAPGFTICAEFTPPRCWTREPVHTMAQRIGDDPAILLRNYTKLKRSKQADERLAETIAGLSAGFLKLGPVLYPFPTA